MARKLIVEIVGDSRSLEKSFDRSAKSARKFNGEITKTGATTRGFGRSAAIASGSLLGGVGFIATVESSINAASDFAEEMSKTNAVFEGSAKQVEDWSKTTTDAFGISKRQALETASSFGALFAPIGIAGDEAARQSERLVELGADLASFYNTDVQSALDAIRSGLVGESEPLRRYGVRLSEARVQAVAMAESGKKNAKALTEQEKALARLAIVFRDTTKAQGDFARSSDRLPAQIKKAQANIDNLKVDVGLGLVPALSKGITWLNKFGAAMKSLGKGLDRKRPYGLLGDWLGLNPKQPMQAKPIPGLRGPVGTRGLPPGMQGPLRGITPTKADVTAAKRTAEQRNAWFDAMIGRRIDRVQDAPLRQQLVLLRRISALITARIAITKDITRKLNLEDQLLEVSRMKLAVRQEIADQAAAAAEAAEIAAQAARDEARAWADFAIERAAATEGLKDDLKAAQAKLKLLEKQAGVGKKTADQAREIWEAQQEVKRIRKEMAKDEKGGTRFKPLNVKSFIASLGLDLSVSELRRLTVAISQIGRGGTMPGGRSAAFAGAGVVVNGDVHITGVQSTKQMETELHKRARRRAQHRRGG